MSPKSYFKVLLIKLLEKILPLIQIISFQDFFINKISNFLLDPQVLPSELTSRKLWGLSSRILCNPYAYVHRRPYWFRRLHEIHIERYMRSNLSKGDTFIDIGCNCGHHSILAACLVGVEGKVISSAIPNSNGINKNRMVFAFRGL